MQKKVRCTYSEHFIDNKLSTHLVYYDRCCSWYMCDKPCRSNIAMCIESNLTIIRNIWLSSCIINISKLWKPRTNGVLWYLYSLMDILVITTFFTIFMNSANSFSKYRPAMYVMLRTNLLGAGRSVFP